jgi:CO dehydrogenase/acetyl-CoA synthase gamma subunit (corrinoid Fe-S protein)
MKSIFLKIEIEKINRNSKNLKEDIRLYKDENDSAIQTYNLIEVSDFMILMREQYEKIINKLSNSKEYKNFSKINMVKIKNETLDAQFFADIVRDIVSRTEYKISLESNLQESISLALEVSKNKKPLIYGVSEENYIEFVKLAKKYNCSLVIKESERDIPFFTTDISKLYKNVFLETKYKELRYLNNDTYSTQEFTNFNV